MYLQKINLKKKYALVTGAGKGLGRACSIALAEAGATVIALSRTQSDLNKLEKDIKKIKGKVIKVPCDVMNYEELKTKLEKIKIIDVPVIIEEADEAKKQTVVATSLSVAAFPIGIFPRANFLNFLFLKKFLTIGVSTNVGATVLTLIFLFANSTPIPFVKPSIPNLVIL